MKRESSALSQLGVRAFGAFGNKHASALESPARRLSALAYNKRDLPVNITHSLPFKTGRFLTSAFFCIAIAATGTASRAQTSTSSEGTSPAVGAAAAEAEKSVLLEAYVVSASRTAQNIKLTPSSVTSISLSEMERTQIPDLRTALQLTPGVNVIQTGGGTGSQSAISIRGSSANQTLFVIDGVRMNAEDWTSGYSNYLGSAGLAGLDRVEILRGPQSTLYGSAAMGGVISLETAHGNGAAHGTLAIDGGSFNSIGATIAAAGRSHVTSSLSTREQSLGYSASFFSTYTENDRDFNLFKQYGGSTRLEYQVADSLTAGFTYRGVSARYEEPASTYAPYNAGIRKLDVNIATAYVAAKPIASLESRLTFGWVQNIYDWVNRDGTYPNYSHSTRNVIDWQNTWQPLEQLQVIAGINTEWSIYDSSSFVYSERLVSGYLNTVAKPVKNLELTLGVRSDDYSSFNTHATWRTGAAYRIEQTKTTLRATYGTGFNAPAPQYVLGGRYYAPNADLKPEKSKGWDIGVEQDLWRDRITLGGSFFKNDFSNKFLAVYGSGGLYRYTNVPAATTKGVETFLYTRPFAGLNAQLTYTYLDTRDNKGARLVRMPRNILAAGINYQVTKEFLAGVGVSYIADRSKETLYGVAKPYKMPDYATVRVYGSYELVKGLTVKARIENLFDKKYETSLGYPALPFGLFGGVEWKF